MRQYSATVPAPKQSTLHKLLVCITETNPAACFALRQLLLCHSHPAHESFNSKHPVQIFAISLTLSSLQGSASPSCAAPASLIRSVSSQTVGDCCVFKRSSLELRLLSDELTTIANVSQNARPKHVRTLLPKQPSEILNVTSILQVDDDIKPGTHVAIASNLSMPPEYAPPQAPDVN